jgi:hypothetical protein
MKITELTEGAVLEALRAQDWDAFTPASDLPPLRAALTELERRHGVTKAHRIATERIRERGALLRHPDVHRVEPAAQALSPSGRYLAVGSWVGDDHHRGGVLQIWELASGRCVNVLAGIDGGVGWPGYPDLIQWSADETRIAMVFMTNNVGVWDPFGEESEPIGSVFLCASGRPAPFAFAPDGAHAYMIDDDNFHGTIVSLEEGESSGRPLRVAAEADEEDLDEDDYFLLSRVVWSRDGQRLYGHLHDGRVCSIDVAPGTVSWVVQADPNDDRPPAEWSRDERLVAFHRDGSLVIADAADGRPVAELPGYGDVSFLSWGARLAVVVAGQRVGIVDPAGERRYDLDIAVRAPHHDSDARTWAWAPGDDERAGCLTDEGRIEIWTLGGKRGERLRSFDAPEGANGVLWGADGVIVALGETVLRFLRADSGEVIGDFTLLRQPPGPRPLEIEGEDFGDDMDPEPNPTFALDDDTWAVGFLPGVVIAPSGRDDDLAATLAWAVDHRFAWPVHWGELEVVPDAPSAAERVPEPLYRYLAPFRGRTPPAPGPQTWPPEGTATVDDLFLAFQEAVTEYGVDDRSTWAGEALHCAAVIRARRGEPAGALDLIEMCPEPHRPHVSAEVAMILAGAGLRDEARSLLSRYEAVYETMSGEPAGTAGAVGGAHAALGDGEHADRWFERARETVRENGGAWDHRLPAVWALMECGREDEARALLAEGAGAADDRLGLPFLGYLLRKGKAGLAEELLRSGDGWFKDWPANRLFVEYGQPRLLVEWGERYNCWVKDDLPIAERNAAEGRPAEPSDEDTGALARTHAEILRMPPARRQGPTVQLAIQAAECRHLGAVLDLLPRLQMPSHGGMSSHDRPWVAYSALRIVTTGVDIEPW